MQQQQRHGYGHGHGHVGGRTRVQERSLKERERPRPAAQQQGEEVVEIVHRRADGGYLLGGPALLEGMAQAPEVLSARAEAGMLSDTLLS